MTRLPARPMLRPVLRSACALAGALGFAAASHAGAMLSACGANVDYPPFLYAAPGPERLRGVAIDILRQALGEDGGKSLTITMLPWKRCLKLAELGKIDIVLNVPTAQIDPAPFLISDPYAQLHSLYFVLRSRWPHGIVIRNVQDLRDYRLCGLAGNRYESYGVPSESVDRGANNYASLMGKLEVGHCDLVIEKREVIEALQRVDAAGARAFSSKNLLATPLPEDSPIGLHFALSKRSPSREALLGQLNRTIAALTRTGALKRWRQRHLAAGAAPTAP